MNTVSVIRKVCQWSLYFAAMLMAVRGSLLLVKSGDPGPLESASGKADTTVCNELVTRDGAQTRLRIGNFGMARMAGALGTRRQRRSRRQPLRNPVTRRKPRSNSLR